MLRRAGNSKGFPGGFLKPTEFPPLIIPFGFISFILHSSRWFDLYIAIFEPYRHSMMQTRQFLGLNGTKVQIAIGFLAGMDFLLFGYDQGVTGGLLTLDSFVKYFPEINTLDSYTEHWSPSAKSNQSTRQGITVAAYNLGCFAGSIPTIWIGNILGRRKAIFLGSFIMCIGAILQCTSYGLAQLVIGRLITGFG